MHLIILVLASVVKATIYSDEIKSIRPYIIVFYRLSVAAYSYICVQFRKTSFSAQSTTKDAINKI